MFCTQCGSKVPDHAAACPNCGMAFANAVQSPPPVTPSGTLGYLRQQAERTALASLILGILALFFSIITGIPAIILGHVSLAEIKQRPGGPQREGEGMAIAGLILGYISVAMVPFLLMIAIPNLQHSRAAANQASAAAAVRNLIGAEYTYSTSYPKVGYSPDLVSLGPGASPCTGEGSQKNACLIDGELGCSGGTSGQWCLKDQYRFSIVGISRSGVTEDYVITATPADKSLGDASYCADSDGIVRSRPSTLLSQPLKTVAECSAWVPL